MIFSKIAFRYLLGDDGFGAREEAADASSDKDTPETRI